MGKAGRAGSGSGEYQKGKMCKKHKPQCLMQTYPTDVNIFTRYIYEFDINVNTYYPWKNNGDPDALDVQHVMTHEIGHGLGINHSEVSGATMEPTTSYGQTNWRTIEADDKAAAAHVYMRSAKYGCFKRRIKYKIFFFNYEKRRKGSAI